MHGFWWHLPGPSRFVGSVAQTLREGGVVLVCVSDLCPHGLAEAVKEELSDSIWEWTHLRFTHDTARSPLELMFQRFASDETPETPRSLRTLVNHAAFRGRVLWLDNVAHEGWESWKVFLQEYAQTCRSLSSLDRTRLCVCLRGVLSLDTPPEDVAFAVLRWRGVVTFLDSLIFAAQIPANAHFSPMERQVARFVAAYISMWDPQLAANLMLQELECILDPSSFLKAYSVEHGWCSELLGEPAERLWARGLVDDFDGAERPHSATLILANNADATRELRRRAWKGQVQTLWPFVEEKRQELLQRFSKVLKVPFETRFGGCIEHIADLEVGHIVYQLSQLNVGPEELQFIETLAQIRNELAHLRLVSMDLVRKADREQQ